MARPKKPASEQHVERIAVYLTEEENRVLLDYAAERGLAPAAVARELIRNELLIRRLENFSQLIEGLTNASEPKPAHVSNGA